MIRAARKYALQRIEILGRNRVVLVVVAFRAPDREAEKRARHDVDSIIPARRKRQEAERRQVLFTLAFREIMRPTIDEKADVDRAELLAKGQWPTQPFFQAPLSCRLSGAAVRAPPP